MAKFTPQQMNAVAAIFGRSNMGMGLPKVQDVRSFLNNRFTSNLESAVVEFSRDFLESEYHLKVFLGEAKSWHNRKGLRSLDEIRSVKGWKEIADLMEQAMQEPVS